MKAELKYINKIYSDGSHCAFTDLIYWDGKYIAAFRKGSEHMPAGMGKVYIVSTSDPSQEQCWDHVATLDTGFDNRDPKFFTYEDMLGVVFGSFLPRVSTQVYDTSRKENDIMTHICLSYDAVSWSNPKPVGRLNYWLWSVKELGFPDSLAIKKSLRLSYAPTHIGASYHPITKQDHFSGIYIHVSINGPYKWVTIDQVCWGTLGDDFSEPSICIKDETLCCAIRKEVKAYTDKRYLVDTGETVIASSKIDKLGKGLNWDYRVLDNEIHSPSLLEVKDGLILCGRKVLREPVRTTTELFSLDNRENELTSILDLNARGDNGYPGMILSPDGKTVYISYYSQHEVDIDRRNFMVPKSDIYIACLELS